MNTQKSIELNLEERFVKKISIFHLPKTRGKLNLHTVDMKAMKGITGVKLRINLFKKYISFHKLRKN